MQALNHPSLDSRGRVATVHPPSTELGAQPVEAQRSAPEGDDLQV